MSKVPAETGLSGSASPPSIPPPEGAGAPNNRRGEPHWRYSHRFYTSASTIPQSKSTRSQA